MAGTNTRKAAVLGGPAVVLVAPQLGENIGAAARAMLNCGLVDMRIVAPRDGWPNPRAASAASGADAVIARARLYATTEEAVADLAHVFATSARSRYMVKPVATPRHAAAAMRSFEAAGERCGILFGPERMGLTNEQIVLADTVITVPLNPAFSSLNLAQAVLLVGYEWYQAGDATPELVISNRGRYRGPAPKELLFNFFEHFEKALDEADFFRVDHKRPAMVRNLRNLFQRCLPTEQEVRTLHGIVTALTGRRKDGRARERGEE
jgi:tRNA/rRNA methyltransferase